MIFRQVRLARFRLRDRTYRSFVSAGVDFEEAGGKWRAGDAAKSLRFFSRAVEVYDQGLHRFPSSLDLAYNKLVQQHVHFRPGRLT